MSDNLPAIRQLAAIEPDGVLRDTTTDSWVAVVADVARLAAGIADTEIVPRDLRGNPAAVAAVILYGREIGLPPMKALRTSYVVGGRVGLSAETMRALVLAAGHELYYREATGAKCVAVGRRAGTDRLVEVEWTTEIARYAKLLPAKPESGWTKYPRAMLKARATAELCRDLFPDVIGGFEATEEIDETGAAAASMAASESAGTTTVRRADTAAGRRTKTAPAKSTGEEPPSGPPPPVEPPPLPPLPGEDGYDVPEPPEPPKAEEPEPGITEAQSKRLHAMLNTAGVKDRSLRIALTRALVDRPIASSSELTKAEATALIDTLARIGGSQRLAKAMTQIVMADDPMAALAEVVAVVDGFTTGTDPAEPELEVVDGEVVDETTDAEEDT